MSNRNFDGTNDCLDWGSQINDDAGSKKYCLLDEGDYPFTVVGMRRERTTGKGKLPACNKAALTLRVEPEPGVQVDVKCDLILHRSMEWRLAAFFRCIGLKKRGEQLTMDWDSVIGAKGYGHFKPKEYRGKDDKNHKINDCDKFYDYDDRNFAQETQTMPSSLAADGFVTVDDDDLDLPF